jgi:4'-phosphopantetheinyl transferase EntD
MLETIAPECVAIDVRYEFYMDGLFPEERESLGVVVDKRLREFTTGRVCARKSLLKLGIQPCPIRIGPRREPIWPQGIAGSITHCSGFCAAAVASSLDLCSIGIDAEENLPLGEGVIEIIASPQERTEIRTPRGSWLHWDRPFILRKGKRLQGLVLLGQTVAGLFRVHDSMGAVRRSEVGGE